VTVLRYLAVAGVFAVFAVYLLPSAFDASATRAPAAAAVARESQRPRVFGYGLSRIGGLGAEAWRWKYIQEKRHARFLQKRLTRRVRQARSLQQSLRDTFMPGYWVAIASCESGIDWAYNGSSGFDGGIQFHPGTWRANRLAGYPAYAWQASAFQQLVVGEIVLARDGWQQWPACSRKVGLR